MSKLIFTCLAIALFAFAPACAHGQRTGSPQDLSTASWLAGCWSAGSGDRLTEEQWMTPRGGLMVGMVRSTRGGVARGYEFLKIHSDSTGVVFSAHPSGQAPADFAATVVTDSTLRFVNPAHDFPKKIEYHRLSADHVLAKVYGEVDASESAFDVDYRRARCVDVGYDTAPAH